MSEYLIMIVDILTKAGFLETRAPLYMDIMVSFLASLPILIGISILFAMRRYYKLHKFMQVLFFLLTFLVLGFFAYIVHYQEGFDNLLLKSSIDPTQGLILLTIHILIAISTITLWMFTLVYAIEDRKRRALPGVYSESHRKSGRRVFLGILLTSFSAVAVYWMLFMA